MSYCKVLINNPVDNIYTYSFDDTQEVEFGKRVEVSFGNRSKVKACVVEVFENIEDIKYKIKPIVSVLDQRPIFTLEQYKLSQWIAKFYLCSTGQALFHMLPSNISKNKEIKEKEVEEELDLELSEEQKFAIESINNSEKNEFYLFGITGSGKTHVYFEAAKAAIEKGQQVIYLVPEITLTHQIVKTAKKHFNNIAIIHSKLTPKKRLEEYERIKNNKANFIIGARSAIFAPTNNLGLIIIDEEHETTYKSGKTPRYHARQVAQKRLQFNSNAKLIMGSATPSLEAYKLITEDKLHGLYLNTRPAGGVKPKIKLVDMNHEDNIISRDLYKEMALALSEGKQSILFLNRRGFSHYWHCDNCDEDLTCPNCSVKLTMHKSDNKMVCHYCGYKSIIPTVCPSCNSTDVRSLGIGTEKVQECVEQLLPKARIARLDTDVVKHDGKIAERILKDFKKGEYDILLGTQMVAKGLNFPNVKVVGVVLADTGFHIPDFRANERSFALLLQVSGRAGRYDDSGIVVIQTYDVKNKSIRYALDGDTKSHYEKELEERKLLEFPPFVRIVRFVVRSKDEDACVKEVDNLEEWVEKFINSKHLDCEVMGVSTCPIERINNNFRYQLILSSKDFKAIQITAMTIFKHYKQISNKTYIETDVDPIVLL